MKVEYKNRYGDVFTFTKQENGDILWEGKFEHCRFSWPNVYKDAYQQYRKDGGQIHIDEFKREVHDGSFDDNERWVPSQINKKYGPLVYSDTKSICMVDPSGGPYIHSGYDMGMFGQLFKGRIVSSFVPVETGYLIQTYGKFDHLEDRDTIGGII